MSDYDFDRLYNSMIGDDRLIWKCTDIIDSNKKSLVAKSIYTMVSTDKRALQVTAGRSVIWSIPKGRRENLVAVDSTMSSEITYMAKKRNCMRNVDDLMNDNVIHEFGFRDMTAYCMEPFPLSWKYCNASTAVLFPASIIRLIDSMESLFMSFMANSYGRNVTYDLLLERFAHFVASKREKLHSSIQKKVPKLVNDDYEAYIYQVRSVLLGMDPLCGRQYVKFKMDALPDAVYSLGIGMENDEFASLIPKDARVNRVKNEGSRNSVPIDMSLVMMMESSDGIPNLELDISSDPIHLLQIVERDVKRKLRIPSDRRVFTEYKLEMEGAKKLWNLLDNVGARSYDTIRRWSQWYAVNYYTEDSHVVSCLDSMSETWNRFTNAPLNFVPDYHARPAIVEHLNEIFLCSDRRVAVCESCMTYGFGMTYSYVKVKFGRDSADLCLSAMVGEMESMACHSIPVLRRRLSMMILSSVRNYYKFGTITIDMPGIMGRIQKIKEKCDITIDKSEYNDKETVSLKMFWDFIDSHHS